MDTTIHELIMMQEKYMKCIKMVIHDKYTICNKIVDDNIERVVILQWNSNINSFIMILGTMVVETIHT